MASTPTKLDSLKTWIVTPASKKLGLWLLLSLILSLVFLREAWTRLFTLLNPDYILNFNISPLGVLLICLIFLFVKRRQVKLDSGFGIKGSHSTLLSYGLNIVLGGLLLGAGLWLPSTDQFLTFRLVLVALGAFTILFGPGARVPAILTAIYGFTIGFPYLVEQLAAGGYAQTVISPLTWLTGVLDYPVHIQGQFISFASAGGENISVVISTACAGPFTMSVFVAIFALMMLDRPLPFRKAVWLFLVGVAGTWVQNFVRVVIILGLGYYLGAQALWTAHYWTIYILFPLWYLVFAFIYFWQTRQSSRK